ncbi:uncharacterized protein isoform X1 [Takifugu rubripes]|uniref:uncharacterized protein isoform X1 n=1 Tax=Takifugu rubripes TaxID=31033 RepID=UPI001145D570|nr:uncharacterized protein LOC105416561 isoform X1 [Takifugu rubripes]XP_011603105.2 uncharacterized protein LOC105416561 isoform X1 [Takifugu rubripes]
MVLISIITLVFVLDVCYSELGSPGWREPLDCVRASELCNQNSQCSSRYRIMRQCLSGGDKERSAMLASKECQGALEVLQDSPLYDCRCKRGMKKELQCLQNYWSIHMGLTEVFPQISLLPVGTGTTAGTSRLMKDFTLSLKIKDVKEERYTAAAEAWVCLHAQFNLRSTEFTQHSATSSNISPARSHYRPVRFRHPVAPYGSVQILPCVLAFAILPCLCKGDQ